FVVETAPSPNDSSIIISASYGARTKKLTVIVNGVTPPAVSLSGLTLSPTSAQGGVSVQGTVTLSTSAPTDGIAVALSNGDPSLAGMPTSIIVPAGASQASFTITTTPVSISTTIAFSAVYAGVKKTALLTLQPGIVSAALSSLSLSPTSVLGGDGSQATVTLTAAAPSGGAFVTVVSNSPAATVPVGLTVPAGASSASFTVATSQVSVSTPVSISASYNGVTRSAALTVGPAAAVLSSVALNPTSVVGGNSSQGNLILSGPAPAGGAVVSLSSNNSAAGVPVTASVPAGSSSATFTVTTSQVSGPTSA